MVHLKIYKKRIKGGSALYKTMSCKLTKTYRIRSDLCQKEKE